MKIRRQMILATMSLLSLISCTTSPPPTSPSTPLPTSSPTTLPPTPVPTTSPTAPPQPTATQAEPPAPLVEAADPFELLSQEKMFTYMEDLVAIQPYSGWRNSASLGERQALDYVEAQLGELTFLDSLGLETERQSFHVPLATELQETALHLTVGDKEIEVPADGLRGHRDDLVRALRFDSDGRPNDAEPNPVEIRGSTVLIRSAAELDRLGAADLQEKILLLDYAVVDRALLGTERAILLAEELLDKDPAGILLLTQFSNQVGESHGSFVGDSNPFTFIQEKPNPPILYARLEDLAPAGISDWKDLAKITSARLTWDADVFSPGDSGNLVARIPGTDGSRAMILGAHIDSPNSPGAMDDGSGSVILLEIARVLDEARFQPPTDLYLVWFGSEELGLYGASHFAHTHQELLDRTLAMLQIDDLTHPLEGISAELALVTWSYGRLGDDRLLWPDYLAQATARRGVETVPQNFYFIYSDNSVFGGFDVPNADLIYVNEQAMEAVGGVHYAAHIHSPYDTVELAREVGDVLEQMARVALSAALDAAPTTSSLRVPPPTDRHVLFVASHTEPVHVSPASLTEMGMAFAMAGFDVDLVPYGQPVTPADLQATDLVIALPVLDYPSPEGGPELYDAAWEAEEIAALEAYVAQGGLLVLTNSARRLKYGYQLWETNEDWPDVNSLAERFGVTYHEGTLPRSLAQTTEEHPLTTDVLFLQLAEENGVPFSLSDAASGKVLAQAGGEPVIALLEVGAGQVLALADVSLLGAGWGPPANLTFWQNLAQFARSR